MEIVSHPELELPNATAKDIRNCEELHLAERQLTKLAHFERFVNLEVLWVNSNRLTDLSPLDCLSRLRQLYAYDNFISVISPAKLAYPFLETLSLANNQLRDLDATLRCLSRLRMLQVLDLSGNPIAEEGSYRIQVLRALPNLQVLDNHMVTPEERRRRHQKTTRQQQQKQPTSKQQRGGGGGGKVAFGLCVPPRRVEHSAENSALLFEELRKRTEKATERIARQGKREIAAMHATARQASEVKTTQPHRAHADPNWSWAEVDGLKEHMNALYDEFSSQGPDAMQLREFKDASRRIMFTRKPHRPSFRKLYTALKEQKKEVITRAEFHKMLLEQVEWEPVETATLQRWADKLYRDSNDLLMEGETKAAAQKAAWAIVLDPALQQASTFPSSSERKNTHNKAAKPKSKLTFFSFDVEPPSVEELSQVDHQRPWKTAHLARRKPKKKVVYVE